MDNQPYAAAQLAVDTLAMDYAPYRHPPIGSMDDLEAASADDARKFYQRWYVPNNAVLTVVGDVTSPDVRALVQEYFGMIPRGEPAPVPPAPPATPRTSGERRLEVADPLAQLPLVWIAYNVPGADHRDAYALSLLSSIFSAGESSRLQQRLVQRESAALDVVAFLRTRAGPGTILFGTIPNIGVDIERVEGLVGEEIGRLRTEGVTEHELAKAKNQQRASEVAGRMQVQTKADLLQGAALYHRDPFRVNGEMARYEAVTLADVQRVARTYLTEANRTVVIARPARPGN